MSVFGPGTGDLKSTNIPAALLEIAEKLNQAEKIISTIDNPINNITTTFDLETNSAAITATIPVTASVNTNGQIVVTAANYLGGNNPNFGTGSQLQSRSYPGAFLEIAQILNAAEKAVTPTPPNNVTITFDLEGLTATVAATLPLNIVVDDTGKVVVAATDYLPHPEE